MSILLGKSDVVIAMTDVKLGEQCLAFEFIHHFLYPWHWVMVLDSPGVYPPVINDDVFLSAVFLADEEDRRDKLRWSFLDLSQCLFLFNPYLFDLSFCFGLWI